MSRQSSHNPRRIAAVLGLCAVLALIAAGVWGIAALLSRPGAGGQAGTQQTDNLASAQIAIDAARRLLDQQRAGEAEELLAAAREKFPLDQGVCLLHGDVALGLAIEARRAGDAALAGRWYEASLLSFNAAITLGPDRAEYRHAAGTIADELDLLDEAAAHYAMAQKLDPSNPQHPLYLASVQRKLKDDAAARVSLTVATRLDPSLATAWAGLAGIAIDERNLTMALQYIRRAREAQPEVLTWAIVEARVERLSDRPGVAADILGKFPRMDLLRQRPAIDELAAALTAIDRADEAAKLFADAFSLDVENAELAYEAAARLRVAGQDERALNFALEAQRLGHPQAGELIDALRSRVPAAPAGG